MPLVQNYNKPSDDQLITSQLRQQNPWQQQQSHHQHNRPYHHHHHLGGLGTGDPPPQHNNNPYQAHDRLNTFLRQIENKRYTSQNNAVPYAPHPPHPPPANPPGSALSGWQLAVLCLLGIIGMLIILFLHAVSDGLYYYPPKKGKMGRPFRRRTSSSSRRKKCDDVIDYDYYAAKQFITEKQQKVMKEKDSEDHSTDAEPTTEAGIIPPPQASSGHRQRIYIQKHSHIIPRRDNNAGVVSPRGGGIVGGLTGLGGEEQADSTRDLRGSSSHAGDDEEEEVETVPITTTTTNNTPPASATFPPGLIRRSTAAMNNNNNNNNNNNAIPQVPMVNRWEPPPSPLAPVVHQGIPVYLRSDASISSHASSSDDEARRKLLKKQRPQHHPPVLRLSAPHFPPQKLSPPSSFSSASSSAGQQPAVAHHHPIPSPLPPFDTIHNTPSGSPFTPLDDEPTPVINNNKSPTEEQRIAALPFIPNLDTSQPSTMDEIKLTPSPQPLHHPSSPSEDNSQQRPANPPHIKHKRSSLDDSLCTSHALETIIFDELVLEDVIGGGGFGSVWRAKWQGTPVAVKVLAGMSSRGDNAGGGERGENNKMGVLDEFAAEINMLSGMRHPNICLYIGACLTPPNRAIVTELAIHGSLWDALRRPLDPPFIVSDGMSNTAWPQCSQNVPEGNWPWCLVKRVASGAARGMTYLHNGKPAVLHRDLKSANLLLDESYTTKVADFGLSRLKAQERSMTGNCGTVQWMAPEVLANERYAEPADVYSFGIILWELLTRECPYDNMNAIQCALAVLNKGLRPTIPDWCPPPLEALITTCWAHEPSQRPTFAQVLAALDAMP